MRAVSCRRQRPESYFEIKQLGPTDGLEVQRWFKTWLISGSKPGQSVVPVTEMGKKGGGGERTREEFQTFHFELVKFKKTETPKWDLQRRPAEGVISMELDEFFKRENFKREESGCEL